MRLLIISHIVHDIQAEKIVGPSYFVKEVNWLAKAVDQVSLLACYRPGTLQADSMVYSPNVNFTGLPPSGGYALKDKLRTFRMAGTYIAAIRHHIKKADVIHVRVPGGLGLYGLLICSLLPKKLKWYKFAGNFIDPEKQLKLGFFQYYWLSQGLGCGPVTINGNKPDQKRFLYSFLNPSFSIEQTQEASILASKKQISKPLRIVFAGRLEECKGAGKAIEIIHKVRKKHPIQLDIFGDGPEFDNLNYICKNMGIEDCVTFHGWQSQEKLHQYLTQTHFVLLPSASEGWPKILSEGMTYGAVPVASSVSAIPQVLSTYNTGVALPVDDLDGYAQAICTLAEKPDQWKEMSLAGLKAAKHFTYEKYLLSLEEMFQDYYHQSPFNQQFIQELQLTWQNVLHNDLSA